MINKSISILVLTVLQLAALSSAHADPSCLIGKWQVVEEVVNVNSPPTRLMAGDWSVSGDLLIEILPSADVRLVYDDYAVRRASRSGTFEVLLEIQYRGEAEGRLSSDDGMARISLYSTGDVVRSMRQKIGDGGWLDVDEDNEKPPHEQRDYTFACDGDELTLSKTEEGPFGGDYDGHFVRVD